MNKGLKRKNEINIQMTVNWKRNTDLMNKGLKLRNKINLIIYPFLKKKH